MNRLPRYLIHAACNWTAIIFPLVVALGVALYCSITFAKSSSSGINGLVADPNGAVIPGAKIILKNVDTSVERSTLSNDTGNYFFTSVPPGRYVLIVSATGFSPETISSFEINVAQVVTMNVVLKLGSVTQSVTVQATNTEVESSTAQLGTTINTKAVNSLPLNGRSFTQLLDLTPGVSPISTGQNANANRVSIVGGSGITNYAFPSINGASNRSTMYLVDGMNDNNTWFNTYAVPPIIDTIDEFKINSHNDGAQYGGVTGGVVNIVTKAGTNAYHGSAWEFVRTNSLDALPYFVAPPSYHLNTFGSQVGGPVQIPKIYNGKNKTFFEVGFEISHFEQADPHDYLEPTAAELGESTWGAAPDLRYMDFSSAQTGAVGNCLSTATTVSTAPCQLYDPTVANFASTPTRPAYLGNQIPISELSPESLAYIHAIFKTPPIVIPGIPSTVANGQTTIPEQQETYNYTGRVDEHIGDKDFIIVRFSAIEYYNSAPLALPTLTAFTDIPSQEYGVSWTHLFGPRASIQVQYDRAHVKANVDQYFAKSSTPIWKVFGCSPNLCDSYVAGAALMPTISITGGFSGGEENIPFFNLTSTHEWSGIFSMTIGSHLLQAGGGWDEVNYTADQQDATLTYKGTATGNFTNNPDSPPGVKPSSQPGFGLADFLLDFPDSVGQRNVAITERPGGIGDIFLQDSWKINSKLTANYGLRYDRGVIPPYGTEANQTINGSIDTGDFDLIDGKYIVQQLPKLCSVLV
ncbi:MAG: carboxypeptidase regulatory-like domain-containing protein [Nitrososphaerota archaeon]|nr:carboxypeptidase regulatory-like domain-containing protein [Nitrososphaerota archaeon]